MGWAALLLGQPVLRRVLNGSNVTFQFFEVGSRYRRSPWRLPANRGCPACPPRAGRHVCGRQRYERLMLPRRRVPGPVGADNSVTLRDLRILVDQAAEPVASSDADGVVRGGDGDLAVGCSLAECPVRPVGVVVIDVFAEGVVEMSSAGDEDAIGALAPGAGDLAFADGVRARRLDRRPDDAHPRAAVNTASNASVYLASRSLIRNFRPSARSA
jgi:hypothetical protein